MILGLEPYQALFLLTCLVLALIHAVGLAALVSVFLVGAPTANQAKQLTAPTRAVNPLSPSPSHARPVLPPLVR